jgi:hypothetical protein
VFSAKKGEDAKVKSDEPNKSTTSIAHLEAEIIAAYRHYFQQLQNGILPSNTEVCSLAAQLREAVGDRETASKYFHRCYVSVLKENPWAMDGLPTHWETLRQ